MYSMNHLKKKKHPQESVINILESLPPNQPVASTAEAMDLLPLGLMICAAGG
jgi:hypothetical protein